MTQQVGNQAATVVNNIREGMLVLRVKTILWAFLAGCTIGLLPMIVEKLSLDSTSFRYLANVADFLSYPGYVVALGLVGGRFHDLSFTVLIWANVAIYSGLAYSALTVISKLRSKE